MADVCDRMGLALANIHAYLLSGDEVFKTSYQSFWVTNEHRYNDLKNTAGLLTSEQRTAYEALDKARQVFAPFI